MNYYNFAKKQNRMKMFLYRSELGFKLRNIFLLLKRQNIKSLAECLYKFSEELAQSLIIEWYCKIRDQLSHLPLNNLLISFSTIHTSSIYFLALCFKIPVVSLCYYDIQQYLHGCQQLFFPLQEDHCGDPQKYRKTAFKVQKNDINQYLWKNDCFVGINKNKEKKIELQQQTRETNDDFRSNRAKIKF